jgi:hypothetical protein
MGIYPSVFTTEQNSTKNGGESGTLMCDPSLGQVVNMIRTTHLSADQFERVVAVQLFVLHVACVSGLSIQLTL